MNDAQTVMEEAKENAPTLEESIEKCAGRKTSEDNKLEVIFEETKEVTEQLWLELKEMAQELAPL